MERISRFVEDMKLADNIGMLTESIFAREYLPGEYNLVLYSYERDSNSNMSIRIYPRERHIIIENFDRKDNQIAMQLKTPQDGQNRSSLITINVMEGRQGNFRNFARGAIEKGRNGKWSLNKWQDDVSNYLKTAKPTLSALNDHLNERMRKFAELKRKASGSWSFLDMEEVSSSRPIVRYELNESEEEKPITQFSLLIPSTPDEARDGQIGHILSYRTDGNPVATGKTEEQRLEIYKVEPILDTEEPEYVLIMRQKVNEDTDVEEMSVIGGNIFTLNSLQEHIAHSLWGNLFSEWLQQTKANRVAALHTRREI